MIKKITLLSLLSLFATTFFVSAEVTMMRGKSCEKDNLEKCCDFIKKQLADLDRGSNKINCKLEEIKEKLCQDLGVDWFTLCSLTEKMDTLSTVVYVMASQLDAIYNGNVCLSAIPGVCLE